MQEHPPALTSKGDISMAMYKDLTPEQKAKRQARSAAYDRNKRLTDPLAREKFNARGRSVYHKIASERPWQHSLVRCKQRAKKSGVECTIDSDYLKSIWNDVCPILGIPLIISKGKLSDNSPSIDRIDPSKGYVPGNVVVISNRANVIKSYGTLEEHRKIVNFLELAGNDSGSCSSLDHQKPL
jgi:hypothetical protein